MAWLAPLLAARVTVANDPLRGAAHVAFPPAAAAQRPKLLRRREGHTASAAAPGGPAGVEGRARLEEPAQIID